MNWDMRGVLSALSFTDSEGVRYLNQAWLRKATNIFRKKQGNVLTRKRPAAAGLFVNNVIAAAVLLSKGSGPLPSLLSVVNIIKEGDNGNC